MTDNETIGAGSIDHVPTISINELAKSGDFGDEDHDMVELDDTPSSDTTPTASVLHQDPSALPFVN